jgi:RNA polymerase sigma-70 factor, ECF subfamily
VPHKCNRTGFSGVDRSLTDWGEVDTREFDEFYAATVDRLTGQLYAMTGDLAEAQDVVQEAFVRAWQRRRTLSAADHPEAWVRTVAWRLAVSRWRRVRNSVTAGRRQAALAARPPQPSVDSTALVAALRQISEVQRVAIVLHHLCDMSVEQVALETGVPVGTVKARLARGRVALAPFVSDTEINDTEINDTEINDTKITDTEITEARRG